MLPLETKRGKYSYTSIFSLFTFFIQIKTILFRQTKTKISCSNLSLPVLLHITVMWKSRTWYFHLIWWEKALTLKGTILGYFLNFSNWSALHDLRYQKLGLDNPSHQCIRYNRPYTKFKCQCEEYADDFYRIRIRLKDCNMAKNSYLFMFFYSSLHSHLF